MTTMTLTSKRQATLPRELCEDLGVQPGDQLDVERAMVNGQPAWILRPRRLDWSWIGAAQVPSNVSHDLNDIRASIALGVASERS